MQGVGRVLGSIANRMAHNDPCAVYIDYTYGTDPTTRSYAKENRSDEHPFDHRR